MKAQAAGRDGIRGRNKEQTERFERWCVRADRDAGWQGGPKKPATSFVLFSNTMREQVKQDHPGLSFTELGRKLGEMWREMDPNIRKDYEDRATAAKDRYLEEKKAWLAQRAAQGQGLYSQE